MDYKDIENVLSYIETSTGTEREFTFETVCERLIELAAIKDRIQNDIDILKDSIDSMQSNLPFRNEIGEVITESKSTYEHDIKAIKAELPEEVFIECVSITKSRIKDAVVETDADKRKDLIKKYTAIVEKHQTKRDGRSYVKVNVHNKSKVKGVLKVK